MEFEERILLSLVGAIIGFALSQSFNIVRFLRRPKFEASHVGNGVLSCCTGNPPEVPADVVLGFFLKNCGRNPARNTRVFISELRSANNTTDILDEGAFEFSELKRPIDIIPPGESIMVILGSITSEEQHLNIPFEKVGDDELIDYVRADTTSKKVFSAKFHIYCNDIDSNTILDLVFCPSEDDMASIVFKRP